MLRIVDSIPCGCWIDRNLIGKIVLAINSFECNFALDIICFMISVCVHLSSVKLINLAPTSSFALLLVKCNVYITRWEKYFLSFYFMENQYWQKIIERFCGHLKVFWICFIDYLSFPFVHLSLLHNWYSANSTIVMFCGHAHFSSLFRVWGSNLRIQ